jgi:heme exporter protein D
MQKWVLQAEEWEAVAVAVVVLVVWVLQQRSNVRRRMRCVRDVARRSTTVS